MSVVTLPALSVAVTVNVCVPTVEVSIGEPFGTVPTQVSMPEPVCLSAHLYFAFTTLPTL